VMAKLRMFLVTYHDLGIRGDVEIDVFKTLEDAETSALETVECTWCDFVEIREIDVVKGEIKFVKKIDSDVVEEDDK
jgi:hypothetical protein